MNKWVFKSVLHMKIMFVWFIFQQLFGDEIYVKKVTKLIDIWKGKTLKRRGSVIHIIHMYVDVMLTI